MIFMELVTGKKVRVLTPQEVDAIAGSLTESERNIFKISISTGEKYAKIQKMIPKSPSIQVWNRNLKTHAFYAGIEYPGNITSKTLAYTHRAWMLTEEIIRSIQDVYLLASEQKYEDNEIVRRVNSWTR